MPGQVRKPAVAGQFYPASRTELTNQIEECFLGPLGPGDLPKPRQHGPREIVGIISPHAGYMFSGQTAAHGYLALARDGVPEVVVVVGLNHGRGGLLSAVQTEGGWMTPLGTVPIEEEVAEAIATSLPGFTTDPGAFFSEHSIEVQLPFLQYIFEEALVFVPVMMAAQDIASARAVGEAVAGALQDRDGVIVASTDMTHYEPASAARRKDSVLIQRIEAMDPEGLVAERDARHISMCGVGPVAAALTAAKALGATRVASLAYSTSGDVMPSDQVVGYYAAAIRR
ncbi:MAG: AmmeMemoRadiSam system protein B [Armatimonadota bacterium]